MSRFATFNRLAEAELREVVDYYESEAVGLGSRFLSALEVALDGVLQFPQSGAPLRGSVRRKGIGRFPYQILYCQHDEEVRVLAIMHKRRRPMYWTGRV